METTVELTVKAIHSSWNSSMPIIVFGTLPSFKLFELSSCFKDRFLLLIYYTDYI